MKITSKGQVTLPLALRKQSGLVPDTEVEFELVGGCILIKKAKHKPHRGAKIVERMKGRADIGMTTDEIMKLTRSTVPDD